MSLVVFSNIELYLKLYTTNWRKLYEGGREFSLWDILYFIKYYFAWRSSLKKPFHEGPVQDGIPWITFPAINFLKKQLSKSDKVFEYGIGGSTIFLAERVDTVISVEHEQEWFQLVLKKLDEKSLGNVTAICIQAEYSVSKLSEPSDYESCYSSTGLYFQKYVNFINEYPEKYFDLVVIDGRARPSCIIKAQTRVKPGKYLLLDNSDRLHYQLAINSLLKGWKRITFEGPTPYLQWFTQTSVWQKPV